MKTLIVLILLLPGLAIANEYEPFNLVKSSNNHITLTFNNSGINYNVTYKKDSFIAKYGQDFNINVGDAIILQEKHTKYTITAISNNKLSVQYSHNFNGAVTERKYDITFK